MLRTFIISALLVAAPGALFAQMHSGDRMKDYGAVFDVPAPVVLSPGVLAPPVPTAYTVKYLGSSVPGSVLIPGEQATAKFLLKNTSKTEALVSSGKVDVIQYGTKGIPGDVWVPQVFKIADLSPVPIQVNIPAGGTQEIDVTPSLPETKGGYALVFDLGTYGRQFGTSLARTFAPSPEKVQFPKMALEADLGAAALQRIGIQMVRMQCSYTPTDHAHFAANMANLDHQLKEMADHQVNVLLCIGGSAETKQPLNQWRFQLDDKGVMKNGQFPDLAWPPEQDADFRKWVALVCTKYGWPKGPVTGVHLWDEPWEGGSIAGWDADMIRYREMYTAMAAGVYDARKEGADVLVGGCDSSTNAMDKLFSDGTTDFLSRFDFVSIHYQGIAAPALFKIWHNRTGPEGRTRIWDTESWVANTDDRVATITAVDRAAGYDLSMGVFFGNVADARIDETAWSPAAAVGAVTHFIGDRVFNRILLPKGLPWIMVFDGFKGDPDDGTAVVIGDISEACSDPNSPLYRGVSRPERTRHQGRSPQAVGRSSSRFSRPGRSAKATRCADSSQQRLAHSRRCQRNSGL